MHVQTPSVRRPRTFFDIFGVTTISIVLMAVVLAIWHGTIVRLEMVVFVVLVFFWAAWAVNEVLKRSVEDTNRGARQNYD